MKLAALILALCFVVSAQAPTAVPPLNSVGVATGCDNVDVNCTYTDTAVPAGPHFYFVVAENTNGYSGPSDSVNVAVPADGKTHNVVLTWDPSTTTSPICTYFIYRGAPPTGLTITDSN